MSRSNWRRTRRPRERSSRVIVSQLPSRGAFEEGSLTMSVTKCSNACSSGFLEPDRKRDQVFSFRRYRDRQDEAASVRSHGQISNGGNGTRRGSRDDASGSRSTVPAICVSSSEGRRAFVIGSSPLTTIPLCHSTDKQTNGFLKSTADLDLACPLAKNCSS